jgi:hypothetical protein
MPDVENLFQPRSQAIRTLLSGEAAFEIPPYQRAYRWKPATVRDLFEDAVHGLNRLADESDAVTFIGAIIGVNGASTGHRDAPAGAKRVIDGQQRLTTIILACVAAHEMLESALADLSNVEDAEEHDQQNLEWVGERIEQLRADLFDCIAIRAAVGDAPLLPRVVRDGVDNWSTRLNSAVYRSPVAHLIRSYCIRDTEQDFTPTAPDTAVLPERWGASADDHDVLIRRYHDVKKVLRNIGTGTERDNFKARISLAPLFAPDSHVIDALFDPPDAESVRSTLITYVNHERTAVAFRLFLFMRFLITHVALTSITASNEGYAFDMFDSLNSTGEPLTAFETFVPLVWSEEGEASEGYDHVSAVGEILPEDKLQTETANFMVQFLLAETGQKVSKRHNDQRRLLDPRYLNAPNSEARSGVTRHALDTAVTDFGLFRNRRLNVIAGEAAPRDLAPDVAFCLQFLNGINHTIVVAPLSRFVARFRDTQQEDDLKSLEGAVRVFVAFSALWRCVRGGAEGIDSVYRELMRTGYEINGETVPPLRRTASGSYEDLAVPNAEQLGAGLRLVFETEIGISINDGDGWISAVEQQPLYRQRHIARLLLLIANHRGEAETGTGLVVEANPSDDNNMLLSERWSDERLETVEHVAPQRPDPDQLPAWDQELYSDYNFIHTLGNLTLSPLPENITLGRKPWPVKRIIYGALSAATEEEAGAVLAEAGEAISADNRNSIVNRRRYLPLMKALALKDGDWDAQTVTSRTKNLLERSWAVFDTWLRGEPPA